MIDFYTWATPNGRKVSIMLEELGADYTVHPVNIGQGEQHEDAFLAISPNNKIPAIYDHETDIAMMETGAILIYLAERHGKFLPNAPREPRNRITFDAHQPYAPETAPELEDVVLQRFHYSVHVVLNVGIVRPKRTNAFACPDSSTRWSPDASTSASPSLCRRFLDKRRDEHAASAARPGTHKTA